MKLTRKIKRLTYAQAFEAAHYQRIAAQTRARFSKEGFLSLDDIMDLYPIRFRRRVEHDSAASVREQRRCFRAGFRSNLNYAITVAANSDLPRTGCQLGRWLYLEAAKADYGDDRMVAILAGGPLTPPPCTPRHRWHVGIDTWFNSLQEAFGGRKPWQLIGEDGMQGALRVAVALDAMNPNGPTWPIRNGRRYA